MSFLTGIKQELEFKIFAETGSGVKNIQTPIITGWSLPFLPKQDIKYYLHSSQVNLLKQQILYGILNLNLNPLKIF